MAAENNLGKDKVSRLVWRIAIPSMLAQFVSVLYSIVDRIYIGNIPEMGDAGPGRRGGVRPGGDHGRLGGGAGGRGRRAAGEHPHGRGGPLPPQRRCWPTAF